MHFHFPIFVAQIFNPAAWQTEDFITSYASFWIKFVCLNRNLNLSFQNPRITNMQFLIQTSAKFRRRK